MNRSKFIVILLVANLVLVLVAAYFYSVARRAASAGPAGRSAGGNPAPSESWGASPIRVVKTNIVETNDFRWAQLESEDYYSYIARLRSIGCPEQTIRDLIIADIDKLFAPRLHAINPSKDLQYWQPDDKELESPSEYRDRLRQQREIDFAKRQVLQELLGIDLVNEREKVRGTEDHFGRRLGFLPDAKRSEVRIIIESAAAAEVALRQKTWEEGETLTEEDQAQLRQIAAEREAAIAEILSPAELEQYELALSPLAYKIRDSLFGMNPTEREYLAVFQLHKDFEQKWPSGAPEPTDPQAYAEWQVSQAELQAGIHEALGEQRYAEYLRAHDPDFRHLATTAARYDVPLQVTAEVYEYKRILQEQRAMVAGNRSLTPEQQQAALEGMATVTEQAVRNALGEKAFRRYLHTGHGNWIYGGPTAPAVP